MAKFFPSYREAVAFEPQRFNPVVLAESEKTRVILACFEPGQFIPVHRPGVDLTLVVLEGKGQIVAGEQEARVGPGAVAFVPAGEARGIQAETRMMLLHVVTAPPTEKDHAEVKAGLQKESWP